MFCVPFCNSIFRGKSVIARHIGNIFNEGELERESVVAKFATVAANGAAKRTSLPALRYHPSNHPPKHPLFFDIHGVVSGAGSSPGDAS